MVNADSPAPRRRRLSSGALQRLEIAIRLVEGGGVDALSSAELRDAVREQATHLRDQGEPTERVVTEIKREVADVLARTGVLRGDGEGAQALMEQVVRWASEVRGRAD
jgi:hypothetical protein